MAVHPRNEQETILTYDKLTKVWHYYSDVPEHNHKYEKLIDAERKEVESNGRISVLEGDVLGGVTVRAPRVKRQLTEEQRRVLSDRAKAVFGHHTAKQTDKTND